ncbi:flagellar biosynthesis repressor FlbT [Jannaschia ovalis]|uniref:Flagellar biosynthesis repressor FlbT n=1 Tax=Jannaschia ovalis TaxID=3038773 RepID=A0ABY8LFV4_9RHOB|nr:flagellar biosynthesis repressor FlbT [Jannaschia sp. GRR-S6-38]WGH80186.1 flagellar biosynthesis repressor FlbT [Jannaschia sp. GRR-S6-38]
MLKLPAGERILVNGAVLENAGRGARLRVLTPNTQLLRLRDAIDPTGRLTPVSRIAHAVQMMLLGEAEPRIALPEALEGLVPLRHAFTAPEDRDRIDRIAAFLQEERFYQALRQLGALREREARILAAAG